jgi:hypothetical protein
MEEGGIFYQCPFGQFSRHLSYIYGTLLYFVVIWYIFPVLVHCTTKNLATMSHSRHTNCPYSTAFRNFKQLAYFNKEKPHFISFTPRSDHHIPKLYATDDLRTLEDCRVTVASCVLK